MELEAAEDFFGAPSQVFQLCIGVLGSGEVDQLHLVELMLANESPRVFAVGSGFAAEAGSIGRQPNRQLGRLQGFSRENVGDRDLGRGNQPVVRPFHLEQIAGELGELTRPRQAGRIDHKGRQHFQVAEFPGVDVQHEVDQGPFQAGPRPRIEGEPCPGDLGGPFQVQNAQARAQVPVGTGLKVKVGFLAVDPDFDVLRGIGADRNAVVGEIGKGQLQALQMFLTGPQPFVQLLDPKRQFLHLGNLAGGVLSRLLQGSDGLVVAVAAMLELLGLLQQLPSLPIEVLHRLQRNRGVALGQLSTHQLGVISNVGRI